jgi:hypothetical protein
MTNTHSIGNGFKTRPLANERVSCFRLPSAAACRALIVLLLASLVVAVPVSAQQASPVAVGAGLATGGSWLQSQEAPDGGFIGFSGTSDAGTTVDAILAMAALQQAGIEVDLTPALHFLLAGDTALVYAQTGAGQAAKPVLAVVAAGGDPHNVAGVDPFSLATRTTDKTTGLYGTGVFDHSLVMLAMAAIGEKIPKDAVSALVKRQLKDGSFAFDGSKEDGAGDTNTTAIAIQALVAAGYGGQRDVRQALDYLKSTELDNGGFPFQPGEGVAADANSTGIVVQALFAAGVDPTSSEWKNAYGALVAFQNPSGAFRYMNDQPDDNLFATVQALPALARVALPIVPTVTATPIAA